MSISITNIEELLEVNEKTRNLYDNYDKLVATVKYDSNKNVDYVLKTKNNPTGKNLEIQKYQQVQIDVTPDRGPTDITSNSVRLRARIYKNDNSKIYETGFIYWVGNQDENILDKSRLSNFFDTPSVYRGNISQTITDLADNTTYNYRAYVRHEYGTNYSTVNQFTTIDTATIFSIAGDRFNGPAPLTVNLSAINAGFGPYSYAWNMTGGNIGFKYPLNSINVTFSGQGYTPLASNYTLQSITMTVTGNGYEIVDTKTLVLVNGVLIPSLTANLGYNPSTENFGVTSVSVPSDVLSGYTSNNFNITFAPSGTSSMFFVGLGDGNSSPYTDEALIASSIQSLNPAPEFIVHSGDINQEDTEASFVENFLPLWQNSPLLSAMYLSFGNHDLQDGTYGDYLLNYLPATRDQIGSTNRTNKKYCYDFVKGQCHFFVINTGNNDIQAQGTQGDTFADINGQLDEILPKITASQARWKIFVCHRPPYTNDELHRPGFFGYAGPFWQNIKSRLNFASLGIDLVLNGHGQQYSVFQKDGVYFVQNGVGGANRRNGIEPYLPETVTVINQKTGYIKYYVSFNEIRWELVDVENSDNILDSRTITKSTTVSLPASGTGTASSYTVERINKILVDGTYQPSLSVVAYPNPETGFWAVSAIQFLSGPIDYNNNNNRVITLSSNGPVDAIATLSPNSNIAIINADHLGRTITHTYSSGGNFIPKVWALFGDQIQKEAVKIIRVTGGTDYSPEWQTVLNSPYANNIIAAYDFRNVAGTDGLNRYPWTLFDMDPQNTFIAGYTSLAALGGYTPFSFSRNVFVETPFLPLSENWYNFSSKRAMAINGAIPTLPPGEYIGGYDGSAYFVNGQVAGYNVGGYLVQGLDYLALFGQGVGGENSKALRFAPLTASYMVGGYNSIGGYEFTQVVYKQGQRWTQYPGTQIFNVGNPFSISIWLKYDKFEEPGSKILTMAPWGYWRNNTEFSITQSTSSLKIFKNTYLDEVIGGYLQTEPIAGYFTGYPMLCTNDPAKMLVPNVWNHMVVTRDTNNNYRYYRNGVLMLTASDTGSWTNATNIGGYFGFGGPSMVRISGVGGYVETLNLGETNYYSVGTAPASGLIDSLAIWKKELSQEDVDSLYNAGLGGDEFAYIKPIVGPKLWLGGLGSTTNTINTIIETDGDSYWNNVTLYAKFDGSEGSTTILDSSINNVSLSSNGGATLSQNIKKYGDSSARFDGVGGYIQTLSGETYGKFGLEDFTIEWWEYIAGYGPYSQTLGGYVAPIMFYGNPGFGKYVNNTNDANLTPTWGITRILAGPVGGYNNQLRFYSPDLGLFENYIAFSDNFNTPGGTTTLSAWNHNVIQRKIRSSNNSSDFSWYRNGLLCGYQNMGSRNVNIGGYNIGGYGPLNSIIGAGIIGGYPTFLNPEWYHLNGYLDELRISKSVARYSSNFTIPLSSYPVEQGDRIGTRFTPVRDYGGSFAVTQEPVTMTYPHTMVFVGKVNSTTTDRTVLQNLQTTYRQRTGARILDFAATERTIHHGVLPFQGGIKSSNINNGSQPLIQIPAGVHPVGGYPIFSSYIPTGNEWFYIAYSYLGPSQNNTIRYYLQTPSVSAEGTVAGYSAPSFAGYAGFGIGGYAFSYPWDWDNGYNSIYEPSNAINGVVRLGMNINQGFNTHEDMVTLFNSITSGPANDIVLK